MSGSVSGPCSDTTSLRRAVGVGARRGAASDDGERSAATAKRTGDRAES